MAHPTLQTLFPHLQTPAIIIPPMAAVSSVSLCTTTSQSGALPFLAAGYNPSTLPASLPRNTGVGFLVWHTALPTALSLVSALQPPAIWLHAARSPLQLEQWITAVRGALPDVVVFVQVSSVAEAHHAVSAGAHVLAVQGADAGGHGRSAGGRGVVGLVGEVVDAVAARAVVVGGGGVADGRGVAAVLCAGAQGVVVGTRFCATVESAAEEGWKSVLVQTRDGGVSTVRTRFYDRLRGRGGWPEGWDGRAVVNESFLEAGAGEEEGVLEARYREAVEKGDWGRLTVFAGTGVGAITEIRPAKEVLEMLRHDAVKVLRQTADAVSGGIAPSD